MKKVDCHIHIALDGRDWKKSLSLHQNIPNESVIRTFLQQYADNGISYLRDGGDKYCTALTAKKLAAEYGIEYSAPAFPIYLREQYGGFIGRPFNTVDEFKLLVNESDALGADFIKVMVNGILDFNEYGTIKGNPIDFEIMCECFDYAHEHGFSVMAHVNGSRAVIDAINAGVDSIEHGFLLDDEAMTKLATSNTIWVPTFAPIINAIESANSDAEVMRKIAESHREQVANVALNGGLIASGSDAGAGSVFHDKAATQEYFYLKDALGDNAQNIITQGTEELIARFWRN